MYKYLSGGTAQFVRSESVFRNQSVENLVGEVKRMGEDIHRRDPELYKALALENAEGVITALSKFARISDTVIQNVFDSYAQLIQQRYTTYRLLIESDTQRSKIYKEMIVQITKIKSDALKDWNQTQVRLQEIDSDRQVSLAVVESDTRVTLAAIQLKMQKSNNISNERIKSMDVSLEVAKDRELTVREKIKFVSEREKMKLKREYNQGIRDVFRQMSTDHKDVVTELERNLQVLQSKGWRFEKTIEPPRLEVDENGFSKIIPGRYELKAVDSETVKGIRALGENVLVKGIKTIVGFFSNVATGIFGLFGNRG